MNKAFVIQVLAGAAAAVIGALIVERIKASRAGAA